jgi:hypothetical protein
MFLKIKRGQGPKFRRVPATQRLRREIIRYVNRYRPETKAINLLVQRDGRPWWSKQRATCCSGSGPGSASRSSSGLGREGF